MIFTVITINTANDFKELIYKTYFDEIEIGL